MTIIIIFEFHLNDQVCRYIQYCIAVGSVFNITLCLHACTKTQQKSDSPIRRSWSNAQEVCMIHKRLFHAVLYPVHHHNSIPTVYDVCLEDTGHEGMDTGGGVSLTGACVPGGRSLTVTSCGQNYCTWVHFWMFLQSVTVPTWVLGDICYRIISITDRSYSNIYPNLKTFTLW